MIGELVISLGLIFLLVTFLYPVKPFMPHSMHPFMVPLLVVLLIIFGAMVWREAPGDERDQLHKFIAARVAYFAGILTLIVGIIVQSFWHTVDAWLIIASCVMLLGKLAGSLYAKAKK